MISQNLEFDGKAPSISSSVAKLKLHQKPSLGAPAYSVLVNRPAGRLLAAVAYRLSLTPNTVSVISASFTFAAIALLGITAPNFVGAILIAAFLLTGYALDSADGQLARLRGGGSVAGEWLDHMFDAAKISSLHLAVMISMYRYFDLPSSAWLLVPVFYVVVANVLFFGMILTDQLRRARGIPKKEQQNHGTFSMGRSLLVVPTDYGLLCLAFLLLAWPQVFVFVYCLFLSSNALFLAFALAKWYRELSALEPGSIRGKI